MKTSIDLIAPASAATAEPCYLAHLLSGYVKPSKNPVGIKIDPFKGKTALEVARLIQANIDEIVAAATAKERQARELAEGENKWRDGTPDVPEGKQRSFLVSCNGGKYVGVLLYSNKFWAPCSDDVEPPAGAESNDDGDFCWNGWCEESCDQCDTFWSWGGTVDGWMPLPSAKLAPAPAGGKPE